MDICILRSGVRQRSGSYPGSEITASRWLFDDLQGKRRVGEEDEGVDVLDFVMWDLTLEVQCENLELLGTQQARKTWMCYCKTSAGSYARE